MSSILLPYRIILEKLSTNFDEIIWMGSVCDQQQISLQCGLSLDADELLNATSIIAGWGGSCKNIASNFVNNE